ncbi:hypothetical protein HDU77_011104, partial [Chytriomyces hyalinus]
KQGRLTDFFQITTLDRISKLEISEAEKLEFYRFAACSKAAGKVVDKVVVVMDVKDYPFLQDAGPDTASKCRILGAEYQAALLEIISPENLPALYGGTCEYPSGCNYADVGPWNDGNVEGYPDTFWEGFAQRDMGAHAAVLAAKIAEADVVKSAAAKRGSIVSLKERF